MVSSFLRKPRDPRTARILLHSIYAMRRVVKEGFSRPPDLPRNPSPDGLLFILKNLMIAFQSEIVYTVDGFRIP